MVAPLRAGTAILLMALALGVSADEGAQKARSIDQAELLDLVTMISWEHGLDPVLVHALVRVESDYNPLAVSRKGAMGLMQLMPATAKRLGVADPFDPEQNLHGGALELGRLLDRYSGNVPLALAAYNAGEGAVARYGGVPPYRETRGYVQRIMTLYQGQPYDHRSASRAAKRAPVRLLRDAGDGQVLITNLGRGSAGSTGRQRASRPLLGRSSVTSATDVDRGRARVKRPRAVLGGGFGS